ncbi:hypothetical protein R5R35_014495 [Gryllus longicercus]|uniref:Uncharacterized protein n=1 Tax=Gryllus longicercus TaxID=2509291 RepID=A0AAN9VLT3_9ORTH
MRCVAGLPAVPRNVTASERRHGRVVVVEWAAEAEASEAEAPGGEVVLFVVEERHHVGCHLAAERLGAWTPRHRSARAGAALRGVVRPGRWYQFRVAAVGANGTRGFSQPSRPFKLSAAPRAPDPPLGLRVGPLSRAGDGLRAELSWQRPPSDLPVLRYKVFWSRRLHGEGEGDVVTSTAASDAPAAPADGPGPSTTTAATTAAAKQTSVLVHHQTVGGVSTPTHKPIV